VSEAALPKRTRFVVALVFGLLTAAFCTARVLHEPNWPTDFDQIWYAARALLHGDDPYGVVGPGREFPWLWPLYYPLPAVLLAVPFALLPVAVARVAFSAVAAAVLGWAMGDRVRTHWPILLSAAFIISASRAQWAPLLLAAAWVPALGFVIAAKPTVGLSALAAQDRRGAIAALTGCVALLVVSLLLQPGWPTAWREATAVAPHIQAPLLTRPLGPLLALAFLRWRRAEARLFLALVLVPHTPSLYDLLLLFFACRSVREALGLAVLTQGLYWGIVLFGSYNTFDAYAAGLGRAAVLVVYLPVLVAILLRPNRGESPEWPVPTSPDRAAGWLPRNYPDAILLSLLLVGATMLVWLPLVTYR
jgi:hypothetical protein